MTLYMRNMGKKEMNIMKIGCNNNKQKLKKYIQIQILKLLHLKHQKYKLYNNLNQNFWII